MSSCGATNANAIDDSNSEDDESPKLTSEVVAAIDALHEYAHRDELRTNLSPADPIFRHCGVQSGDNWARRVERLNLLIDRLTASKPLPIVPRIEIGKTYKLRQGYGASVIKKETSEGFVDSDGDLFGPDGTHLGRADAAASERCPYPNYNLILS